MAINPNIPLPDGLKFDDFNWVQEPVIGLSLLIMGKIEELPDSNNNNVKEMRYYVVGKHKTTGQLVVLPTDKILTPDKE